MKLVQIRIKDLFNLFTHTITLNQEERITIITAPNGYGKTIALKCIHSLFNMKISFFIKLRFTKIVFLFDNNNEIEIEKINIKTDEDEFQKQKLKFNFKKDGKIISTIDYPSNKMMVADKRMIPINRFEDFLPNYIRRIDREEWIDENNKEILTLDDILYRYSDVLPERYLSRFKIRFPKDFSDLLNSLKVYLIQEQRLVLREPVPENSIHREIVITDTIEKYARELSRLIKDKINNYAEITQTLDSSFPKRLFQQTQVTCTTEELKDRLDTLQEKRQKLSEYGLLKSDEDSLFSEESIKESDTKVLSLYISDNEKKLEVYDNLIARIDTFTRILNERRFAFKKIEIDKDKGFSFKSIQDEKLQLTELSSGEQHEVVLLFELLFKAQENSLVLIDEPEISLHVVWQLAFLDDIKDIINLQKIDVVIATHSPQIINDNWDLTVNLEDSYNG